MLAPARRDEAPDAAVRAYCERHIESQDFDTDAVLAPINDPAFE